MAEMLIMRVTIELQPTDDTGRYLYSGTRLQIDRNLPVRTWQEMIAILTTFKNLADSQR